AAGGGDDGGVELDAGDDGGVVAVAAEGQRDAAAVGGDEDRLPYRHVPGKGGDVDAEVLDEAQSGRRQAVAARLVTGERRLVDDEDVEAAAPGGQAGRRGGPARPPPSATHPPRHH